MKPAINRLVTGLTLFITVLTMVSCASTPSPPPQRIGEGESASWAFHFDNLDDLCAHSDIIVVGTVDRVIEVIHQGGMLYQTNWAFRVEKILKGETTGEIAVAQMGSPDEPGTDIREAPLFLPGERYLLFLREADNSPGLFGGFGPWGRYMVWENRVYSMNHILLPGAYQAPPRLNFDGVALNDLTDNITEINDSVQLTFTQGVPRLQADVLRYAAGTTLNIDVRLSSGKNGPGKVTYKIETAALPEGLEVSIRPAEFTAYPQSEYKSTLIIMAVPELYPGTYEIPVEYGFEGVGSGHRTITFHVNPAEISQIE